MTSKEWSIQGHLRRTLIGGTGLVLFLGTLCLYFAIDNWLRDEFDQALESKARALMTLTEQEGSGVEFHFSDGYMPEFERETEPQYFEVWMDNGVVLERSRSLGNIDLPRFSVLSPQPRFRDIVLPDRSSGRLVQVDFVPQFDDDDGEYVEVPLDPTELVPGMDLHTATLAVARSRESLDTKLIVLLGYLGVFVVVFLAMTAWLVSVVLRIGLRPLEDVASQIHKLDTESLDERIACGSQPNELAPLVEYLNNLLTEVLQSGLPIVE